MYMIVVNDLKDLGFKNYNSERYFLTLDIGKDLIYDFDTGLFFIGHYENSVPINQMPVQNKSAVIMFVSFLKSTHRKFK